MALKDTIKHMRDLLNQIINDLPKSETGNKAASQRVRTGTVRLEKIAKLYRKESIKGEKGSPKSKKSKPASRPKAKAAPASKAKAKAKPSKATRPSALALKRPTAKLPAHSFR